MSTYTYLLFRNNTSYDTSTSYISRLMVLSKDDIVAAGERIGLKLSKSNTKEVLAEKLSAYILTHPKEMVTMLDDEEVVLAHDIIKAGKNAITWRPHRLKYHMLKQMIWVLVNKNKQARKDGFVMLDELQEAFAPFVEDRYEFSLKMVQASKKSKSQTGTRLCLKDLPARLAGLDLKRLQIIHYLFQNNYMEDFDEEYDMDDEWKYEAYHENVYYWFADGCTEMPDILNQVVFEILSEWKGRRPSLYRKAMHDIKEWMTYEFTQLESVHAAEVQAANDKALLTGDDKKVVEVLFPFMKIAKGYISEEKYLEAISLVFALLDSLGKANKMHEEWFDCLWRGGEQTRIATFLEVVRHLYCHLRQIPTLSFRVKEDMDIHLIITNRYHQLFGELEDSWGDSRCDDMLNDANEQYNDYSTQEDTLYDYLEKQLG